LIRFLDSSAWVKRYVQEPGSDAVARLFRPTSKLGASSLALVEVTAALFKRARAGDLAADLARRHAARLTADLEEVHVVEARGPVIDLAADLVSRRALRAYDAVQLASALRLSRAAGVAVTFVCADATLTGAALAEGLRALRVG
jgi:predicted nucleic acid-binding protein